MNSGQWKTVSKNCLSHGFVLLPRSEGGEISYLNFIPSWAQTHKPVTVAWQGNAYH